MLEYAEDSLIYKGSFHHGHHHYDFQLKRAKRRKFKALLRSGHLVRIRTKKKR